MLLKHRTDLTKSRDCFCNYQFNVKACSIQGIFKTADVVKNDPESVACPAGSIDVMSKCYASSYSARLLSIKFSLLPTSSPMRNNPSV